MDALPIAPIFEDDPELLEINRKDDEVKALKEKWENDLKEIRFILFISYCSTDTTEEKMGTFKRALEAFGITAFVAHYDIHATEEWKSSIFNSISNCNAMLALLTTWYSKSAYANQEIGYALGKEKLIATLKIDCDPEGFISDHQAINLKKNPSDLEMARKVAATLAKNPITQKPYSKALVALIARSGSYDQARANMKILEDMLSFLDEEIEQDLQNALKYNEQLRDEYRVPTRINKLIERLK